MERSRGALQRTANVRCKFLSKHAVRRAAATRTPRRNPAALSRLPAAPRAPSHRYVIRMVLYLR